MTALQQIIKEAQAIRRKSPKMEWKKAVAQASAIYSSKNKGKKKVVKKAAKKKAVGKYVKTVRKGKITDVIYKRKKIAGVKKKAIKKTATKKAPVVSRHKDTKSHNVNIRVMSGVDSDLIKQLNTYKGLIRYYTNNIEIFKEAIRKRKERGLTPIMVNNLKKDIKKFQSLIKEYKIHLTQIKKHI